MIGNGSWFVEVDYPQSKYDVSQHGSKLAIPHVIGLCGSGTTGHHGEVESHQAWIKYDGVEYVWYDRVMGHAGTDWVEIGPLDPQPARGEKLKKKRKRLKGEDRRKKINITLKVPKDEQEDGAGLYYDVLEQVEDMLGHDPHRSAYYTIMDALNLTLLHGKE